MARRSTIRLTTTGRTHQEGTPLTQIYLPDLETGTPNMWAAYAESLMAAMDLPKEGADTEYPRCLMFSHLRHDASEFAHLAGEAARAPYYSRPHRTAKWAQEWARNHAITTAFICAHIDNLTGRH